jgi:hypothetical protein
MKKVEGQPEGGDTAGWGVEEADARNKKEASTLSPFLFPLPLSHSHFPSLSFLSRYRHHLMVAES